MVTSKATTVAQYMQELPAERKKPMSELRKVIKSNIPKGFAEVMSYGMIGYVIPLKMYPDGYHCNPELPLPFMNIASQKNFIAVYHMGVYGDAKLLAWLKSEFKKKGVKLDMGKSCLRFSNLEKIPYDIIGELAGKMTPQQWIAIYEKNLKR